MPGRRALVTGGASSIGQAICRRLAADGHELLIHAHRSREAAERLAAEIRDGGGAARSLACDLTDPEAAASVLEPLAGDTPPVQIIVHNAGAHQDAPMAGMSHGQWRDVLAANLDSFFNATRPLLLPMLASRWGRVVALSSVTAALGNRGQANYGAAKAGLEGAVRSLSRELASRGVTANAVAPGFIASPATEVLFDAQGRLDAGVLRTAVPAGRLGQPEEVADLVGFLASEQAGYITGQVININGGMV